MRKQILAIICLLLAVTALGGCAGAKSAAADYATTESAMGGFQNAPADAPAAAPMEMEENGIELDMAADAASAGYAYSGLGTEDTTQVSMPDYGGRKVIRTFHIALETNEFDVHMQALAERAAAVGGYIETSDVSGRKPQVYNDSGRNAFLVFRIPVGNVNSFVENAKGMGTLTYSNENAEDITSRYFDLETRLGVLRTQLERLTSILVETDNLADIIALEAEIARVTLEIEQLTTELRRYDGLVDFATVTVELRELRLSQGPVAEKTVGERISEDFRDSLYGVGKFFVNFFVWFVGALPVIIVVLAVCVGLFFLIRAIVRLGKKQGGAGSARRAERAAKKAAKRAAKKAARQGTAQTNAQEDSGNE